MGQITITHTHADGTLIEGSSKGDGVCESSTACGITGGTSPVSAQIGIGQSRDRPRTHTRSSGPRKRCARPGTRSP